MIRRIPVRECAESLPFAGAWRAPMGAQRRRLVHRSQGASTHGLPRDRTREGARSGSDSTATCQPLAVRDASICAFR
jgi:hypothetical protein